MRTFIKVYVPIADAAGSDHYSSASCILAKCKSGKAATLFTRDAQLTVKRTYLNSHHRDNYFQEISCFDLTRFLASENPIRQIPH